MDRLLEMEVFVAVNEMGSFNKAAERMRMSPPAITRAGSSFEQRLGAVLLTRTKAGFAFDRWRGPVFGRLRTGCWVKLNWPKEWQGEWVCPRALKFELGESGK